MLDIPGFQILDKQALIGGCARLALRVEASRLLEEIESLPAALWGTSGGRVGVHRQTESIFLRGHAPAEGNQPIDDRPVLAQLPYVRSILYGLIPASPLRCLLARMPAGGVIAPHIDQAPYFSKTIRIHIPVATHDRAWMFAGDWTYSMRVGEIWAINNCALHAVWNADPKLSRTHLICDFLPTPQLLALLSSAERDLGQLMPDLRAEFARALTYTEERNRHSVA